MMIARRVESDQTNRGDHPAERKQESLVANADQDVKKDFGPIDRFREQSGLYKLGFNEYSFKGLMFPFVAMIVPIVLGLFIWKVL